MQPLSLWRYGSADPGAFGILLEAVRRQQAALEAAAVAVEEEVPAPPPPKAEPVTFGQPLSDVPQMTRGYRQGPRSGAVLDRSHVEQAMPQGRLQQAVRRFLGR